MDPRERGFQNGYVGGGVAIAATPSNPVRSIPCRTEELKCQIDVLMKSVDVLIHRLHPILASSPVDAQVQAKEAPLGDITSLGRDLMEATRNVQMTRQLLESITERIEL